MSSRQLLALLAMAGGVMLALCIDLNATLAGVSSPLFASWVAHAIGAATAAVLIGIQFALKQRAAHGSAGQPAKPAPLWSYLGGVPGGLALLFAIVVASTEIGFATTISLMIAGQICFGVLADRWGWFDLPRRKLTASRLAAIVMIATGSILLVSLES